MRIKIENLDLDGNPQEIHEVLEKHNIKLDNYLVTRKKPHWIWLLVTGIAFVSINLCIYLKAFNGNWHSSCIVIGIVAFAVVLGVIHRIYDNGTITTISGIIGMALMGMTIGQITPADTVKNIGSKLPTNSTIETSDKTK